MSFNHFLAILLILIPTLGFGCGTEDCPMDCEDKYKCVDHSDLCPTLKEQCENFFFRKCVRCACPKTCGICGDSSSSESVEEVEPVTASSSTTSTATSASSTASSPSSSSSTRSSASSASPSSTSFAPRTTGRPVMNKPVKPRYPAARIQYCDCNIHNFPELDHFIDDLDQKKASVASYTAQVASEYVQGIHPTLALKFANGTTARSIPISGWSLAKVKAFLDDNLEVLAPTRNGTGVSGNGRLVGNATSLAKNVDNQEEEDAQGLY